MLARVEHPCGETIIFDGKYLGAVAHPAETTEWKWPGKMARVLGSGWRNFSLERQQASRIVAPAYRNAPSTEAPGWHRNARQCDGGQGGGGGAVILARSPPPLDTPSAFC